MQVRDYSLRNQSGSENGPVYIVSRSEGLHPVLVRRTGVRGVGDLVLLVKGLIVVGGVAAVGTDVFPLTMWERFGILSALIFVVVTIVRDNAAAIRECTNIALKSVDAIESLKSSLREKQDSNERLAALLHEFEGRLNAGVEKDKGH